MSDPDSAANDGDSDTGSVSDCWGNESNCSSGVDECETRLRLVRDDGVIVNEEGETESDSELDSSSDDEGTGYSTAKRQRLDTSGQKEGKLKLASTSTKWYNTGVVGHRLVGGRRQKGEKRKGFTQATQCYGPGEPCGDDNEYMQPADKSLRPIKIITDNFAWERTDKMKRARTEERKPVLRKWNPTELPSVARMFLSMMEEPLEVFRANTNAKGAQLAEAKKLSSWQPLSNLDCIAYMAAMLRIECANKRTLKESWSRKLANRDPFICELASVSSLSRRKYRRVMGATRLYDEDAAAVTGASDKNSIRYDTQCRIRPFIDAANRSFQAHRCPGDFISLDESMMRYTGRFADKQHMPLKPIRNGIKNFYLCDVDGYTYRILPHTTQTLKYSAECGYIFAVVMALLDSDEKSGLDSYLNAGRTVVTDRYYTSVPIAIALADQGTYYIGTIKRKSKNTPSMIEVSPDGTRRNLLDSKRFPRGASRFWFDTSGTLMYTVWSDSKPVHLLSSYPFVTTQQAMCQRRQRGTSKKLELPRPHIVQIFNQSMSGVDQCDQLLEAAGRHQRSRYWFANFFNRIIGLVVVNTIAVMGESGVIVRTRDMKQQLANEFLAIVKSGYKPRLTPLAYHTTLEGSASSSPKTYQHEVIILHQKQRQRCRRCGEPNGNVKCGDCDRIVHAKCWQAFHNGE